MEHIRALRSLLICDESLLAEAKNGLRLGQDVDWRSALRQHAEAVAEVAKEIIDEDGVDGANGE